MRFFFNERKAAQMAALYIKMGGGKMNYLLLMKLMYLADRMTLINKGRPITGDRYVSMEWGPVLSRVLDLLRDQQETMRTPWFEYISPPTCYEVSLLNSDFPTDELSRYEIKVIESIYSAYGRFDPFVLAKQTHSICPEWTDPGDSVLPIRPEDILYENGVPEKEIAQMESDAKAMEWLEFITEASAT
ncbi:MAG: Panacea domain-containing protein [Candidatus Sumerlaeota bacterium]|nr:Panacea domain-containing protein [Candidatus Sumerlaeota bacterium]